MPITIRSRQMPSLSTASTVLGSLWPTPGRAPRLPQGSAASSPRWVDPPPPSKTVAACAQSGRRTGGARARQPLSRRYLARRGREAQALLPRAPDLCDLCVGLWLYLGPAEAHDSGVFGAAQRAHQGALYACPPLIPRGRSGAEALARWRCEERLDLSQVAGVPGSIAHLQRAHHAVSRRCRRSAGMPADAQNHRALARHPGPG